MRLMGAYAGPTKKAAPSGADTERVAELLAAGIGRLLAKHPPLDDLQQEGNDDAE